MNRLRPAGALLVLIVGAAACSSGGSSADAADRTFWQEMIPHHQRAIAVAMIGERQASDPRVVAFAKRIVREQTPELNSMQDQAAGTHLDRTAGAAMARNRITDTQVSALASLHGTAFDRRFLALNIASEQGAAQMARTELAHGSDSKAKDVAKGIASAPTSEIPELQALAAKIA